MISLPEEHHGAVVSFLKKKYRDEQNRRIRRARRWLECQYAYDGVFGQTLKHLEPYRSRRFLALVFDAVESVSAGIVEATFPDVDVFRFMGRTGDDQVRAEIQRAAVKYQLYRTKAKQEYERLVKAACICGNVPFRTYWDDDVAMLPDFRATEELIAMGQAPPGGVLFKQTTLYSGPRFEVGNIFDFVQESRPANPNRPLTMNRFVRPAHHVRRAAQPNRFGYRMYENVDDLRDSSIPVRMPTDNMQRTADQKRGMNPYGAAEGVEIIEAFGDIPLVMDATGDGITVFENHVVAFTLGDSARLIRFEPNTHPTGRSPWNLFQMFQHNQDPVYGMGFVEMVLDLVDAVNVRMNQMTDVMELVINPRLRIIRDGVFNLDNFVDGPGALIETGPNGGVEAIALPNTALGGFQELQFLMGTMDEITGAQRSLSAGATPISASESNIIGGKLERKNARTYKRFEECVLTPMVSDFAALNGAFASEEQIIRIIGDPMEGVLFDADGMPISDKKWADQVQMFMAQIGSFGPMAMYALPQITQAWQALKSQGVNVKSYLSVHPDDLAGDFDVIVMGASKHDSQANIGMKIQLFSACANDPEMASVLVKPELARSLWRDAKLADVGKLVKSERQVLVEQVDNFLQQLSAQAVQSGISPGLPISGGPSGAPADSGEPGMAGPPDLAGTPGMVLPPPGGPDPRQLLGPAGLL